jgi:hypothetical protein
LLALLLLAGAGCRRGKEQEGGGGSGGGGGARSGRPRPASAVGAVAAEMRNVTFQIDPQVELEIRRLRGELTPAQKGEPPWFDDPSSFSLSIDEAEIAVTGPSMSALLNHYVFNGPDAPVKDVEIEIADGKLRQKATLQKKIPVHVELEGEVSPTPQGDIRLHPTSVKAAGLPVKKLLDLFGVELDELMKAPRSKGVTVDGDDLILDPEKLLPPPRMRGRVTAVRIEGDRLVQVFGGGKPGTRRKPSLPDAANYMFFSGHELAFGKLTMHGADLQIVDDDPSDPFHFFLAKFSQQLVAGYSKTMPDGGLVAYMPDIDDVGRKKEGAR